MARGPMVVGGVAVAIVLLIISMPWLIYVFMFLLFVLLGSLLAILRGGYHRKRLSTKHPMSSVQRKMHNLLYRMRVYPPQTIRPTLISSRVDDHIQHVLDLILKHHVEPIYKIIATKPDHFFESLRSEVWKVLHLLLKRLSQIDTLKLFSADSVETLRIHFAYSRESKTSSPSKKHPFPNLKKFPYLQTQEKELTFLRKATEVILSVCLSREYIECSPVRYLIREYMVCHILQPTIDKLCDPDYINQRLLAYLIKKEKETKSTADRYLYSKTYEDFIKHIQKCEDNNQLVQIRHSIITDIMQAKAVQRMKAASSTGLKMTNLPVSITADKAKTLMDRDLKVYITQLTTAKIVSDRRIRSLGGEIYQQDRLMENTITKPDYPRPIPFETIMLNDTTMMYFLQYLEHSGFGNFISFWREVQDLALVSASEMDSSIRRIYINYLAQGSEYSIYPDPELVKNVEKTLTTDPNACVDAMSLIQDIVFQDLRDYHYEGFLHSIAFKVFMEGEAEHEELSSADIARYNPLELKEEDSMYKAKLKNLRKKLQQQDSSLAYLPMARKESRAQLEKGRSEVQEEIKQLQRYIEHTEEWFGTVGRWNVEVTSVDLSEEEGNDKNPLVLVVVHRPMDPYNEQVDGIETDKTPFLIDSIHKSTSSSYSTSSNISPDSIDDDTFVSVSDPDDISLTPKSAGWVIGRHFSEFQDLHKRIQHISSGLQFPPTPMRLVTFFQTKKYWDNYRQVLQKYLNSIIQDPKLQENEVVFNFLSPASADLSQSGIFSNKQQSLREGKTDDHILDHVSSLISEVFDLQDRSRVLRRQLYDLMQLTFGSNIEGELQDFMKWVVSEPMLIFYIDSFREALWPDGQPAPPAPVRSDEEKVVTKEEAKQRFLKCSPPNLQTILGQRNCQVGLLKMFNTFQDPRANKQLFYCYFQLLLYEIVPELEHVEV